MKTVIFLISFLLCPIMASSTSEIKDDTQQATEDTQTETTETTACSLFTEYEGIVRACITEKNGENCLLPTGFSAENSIPDDVKDVMEAFFTHIISVCDDIQCILTNTVSSKTEHCAN